MDNSRGPNRRQPLNSANIKPINRLPVSGLIRSLWKIIKIVATRCQILRLKCTKFNFGWGSAPDTAGGAYSAPQTPYLHFKGIYL